MPNNSGHERDQESSPLHDVDEFDNEFEDAAYEANLDTGIGSDRFDDEPSLDSDDLVDEDPKALRDP